MAWFNPSLCRLLTVADIKLVSVLMKLFRDLERYDRKPPDKHIVQIVADAYELLGMVEEKERVLEKYSSLFLGAGSDDKSRRSSRKKKKPGQ